MPHRLSLATSLRRAGIATLLIAACLGIAAPVSAQSSSDQDVLIVRVISSVTHQPLVNAEVIVAGTQQSSFTNDLGEARLLRAPDAAVNVRVRQIGFLFADQTVPRSSRPALSADTVVVALEPVSYKLPKVATTVANSCGAPSDSISATLSALVLSQLRLAAERYDAFRQAYPFTAMIERRTVSRDESGGMKPMPIEEGSVESQKLDHAYTPGRVLNESSNGKFMVPILSVSSLADPAFWQHHCFVARGVESLGNDRVIRLDFSPTRVTKSPDWAGSAFIDSATSMLHRVYDVSCAGGFHIDTRFLDGDVVVQCPDQEQGTPTRRRTAIHHRPQDRLPQVDTGRREATQPRTTRRAVALIIAIVAEPRESQRDATIPAACQPPSVSQ